MPNNITNIITVTGNAKKRAAMFKAIQSDEIGLGSIDFKKVIPMPSNIFQGNLGAEERAKYGANNWYDWSVANWGTKWNSYGYENFSPEDFDGERIQFQTAWDEPERVLAALAAQYPTLRFETKWADEDFGRNVGSRLYEHGKLTKLYVPVGGSLEARALAAEVLGYED